MEYHELFEYNPHTGIITWKHKPERLFTNNERYKAVNTRCAGKEVGYRSHKKDGSPHAITIEAFGERMVAHRIAWAMIGRTVPEGMLIDHRDGNPFNNRLSNLRLATKQQNAWNTLPKPGKYRVAGVSFHPKSPRQWSSRVSTSGGKKSLGYFYTRGCAATAFMKARMRYHGEFFRLK